LVGTEGYGVEIFAGPNSSSPQGLGSFALNQTGPAADLGYPNPTSQTFSIGLGGTAWVGYAAFLGPDYFTAAITWPLINRENVGTGPVQTVLLVQAPNSPNTVAFGAGVYVVPEPATLGLLGVGTLALFLGSKRENPLRR
jgi:hypothetical protein